MNVTWTNDPYGTGDSPRMFECHTGEDCCPVCGKQFDFDVDGDEVTFNPDVIVEAGKFCSKRCASQGAFDNLLTEKQRVVVRLIAFAVHLIGDEDVRDFASGLNAEYDFRALSLAAAEVSTLMGDDDLPSFLPKAMNDEAYAAVVAALKAGAR